MLAHKAAAEKAPAKMAPHDTVGVLALIETSSSKRSARAVGSWIAMGVFQIVLGPSREQAAVQGIARAFARYHLILTTESVSKGPNRRSLAHPSTGDYLRHRVGGTYASEDRWLRKKRTISRLASGPRGSVYDPSALPPDQAWPHPCSVQCSRTVRPP